MAFALGDTLYRASLLWKRLPGNTTATLKVLTQTGTGAVSAAPAWQAVSAIGAGTVTNTGTLTANQLVLGNGGVDIKPLGSLGTTTTLLHGNAAGAPTFAKVTTADFTSANVSQWTNDSGYLTSSFTGSTNIVTLGTVSTGTWSATAIAATKGGTGQTVYVVGDLLQASSTTALSTLAAVATGNVLLSGGVGTVSAWGKVGLATHVSGNLPVANLDSGTGATSSTFWRGDGTWAAAGTGSVTSVALTVPTFLSISGSPITTSGTLAITLSGTALPVANGGTGITSFGTGVATALGVNVGSAGAFVTFNGALGTPSSCVATNLTGLPMTTGVTGVLPVANGGTNASSASITAFNNITGLSAAGTTGTTSTNLVFSTSPTLTTPALGVATATSINGNTLTTGTWTLTGAAAKTLTFNNSLTLAGTDSTTMTFPSTSATIARTDAANSFTGNQTNAGVLLGPDGSTAAPTYSFSGHTNAGIYFATGVGVGLVANGALSVGIENSGSLRLNNAAGQINFNTDAFIVRDAAGGILGFRNSTTATNTRFYNTFTTVTTSGEWAKFDWKTTANQFRIGTVRGTSAGTARVLSIDYGGLEASPTAAISIPITSGQITLGGGLILPAADITLDTTTGTKLGDGTTQKLSFWNATPIVQPANTTAIDTLLTNTGLRASGGTANFATAIDASAAGLKTGVFNDGSGFKHARTTTGSIGIGSTALVTVTWGTTFADANYTVSANVLDSTTTSLSLSVVHIESVSASAITVRVLNNSAISALTGTLHAIAVHD